ncbi:hypothetical protein Tco_0712132, partial [Tanacetum coccineum]
MRTRSQSREQRPPPPEGPPVVIEPLRIEYPFQEDPTVEPMADTRTMAQLLQAPTEGYEDAILIPEIVANNFELKHGLINLVQNKQFFGHDKEDPHAHIRYFNKITSTMRVPNVPIATIKLMLFPFSIEGAARLSRNGFEEKLRKLSIEYDEELYPHMLSAIAERRWLISHGLRLAAMSALESQEVKQSFGDVVPGYNDNAYEELVAAMETMKLLELPHIAQLERDQDYPIDVIMAG